MDFSFYVLLSSWLPSFHKCMQRSSLEGERNPEPANISGLGQSNRFSNSVDNRGFKSLSFTSLETQHPELENQPLKKCIFGYHNIAHFCHLFLLSI